MNHELINKNEWPKGTRIEKLADGRIEVEPPDPINSRKIFKEQAQESKDRKLKGPYEPPTHHGRNMIGIGRAPLKGGEERRLERTHVSKTRQDRLKIERRSGREFLPDNLKK